MSGSVSKCYQCGRELAVETDFGRRDSCSGCGRDTHVCKNCIHFDTSRYNECHEPVADRVVDKDRSNFCDYFKAGTKGQALGLSPQERALKAAQNLFKKKS